MNSSLPVASHIVTSTSTGAKNTFKPTRRSLHCFCGKSGTSYPHWPPSCREEAVAQLRCLLESTPHRLYLAHCWLIFLYGLAESRSQESAHSEDYHRIIYLVQKSCPTLFSDQEDLGNHASKRKWHGTDCERLCCRVLREKSCYCLCCCSLHREECPVHR